MQDNLAIPAAHGPNYPALPGAEKHRRLAEKIGFSAMTKEQKREYGRAVLAGIGALNAARLSREAPPTPCPCASGTWHSDGHKILAAVGAQNRKAAGR